MDTKQQEDRPMLYDESSLLPPGYRLEREPDVLTLRRADDSTVGHFSVRGTTWEIIVRAAHNDLLGIPPYGGPQEYAPSVMRLLKTRAGKSWERFLEAERRALDARKHGQLARALAVRLPGESQGELDRMISEDRRRAQEGLVELRSEEGERSLKHIEELVPGDRTDRIRADLERLEWILERERRLRQLQLLNGSKQRPSCGAQASKT